MGRSESVAGAAGLDIQTIEGLDHPVQAAWIAEQVPQCGWCQSGQLLAAAALRDPNPRPPSEAIARLMTNICRCATYPRIRRAIQRAATTLPATPPEAATEEPAPPQEPTTEEGEAP